MAVTDIDERLADPARNALFDRVVRGLGWKVVSQVTTQVTKTVVLVILARALGPAEFGLAALVIVLSSLAIPFADFGLGFALIQRKSLTETDRSTVFWTSVALGLFFTCMGVAVAPLVARFYDEPEVASLFAVMSLVFLVTSIGSTHRSLLSRAMDFRSLELRLVAGNLAGSVIAVTLALKGFGAWAIVAQFLASSIASTLMLWVFTPWRPTRTFSRTSLRELAPFGGRYVGASTSRTLNQNVDNLLIGRFLGTGQLGLYTLAYSVILVPVSRIASPLQQVFGPAFLRLQDDPKALVSAWIRGSRLIAALSIPLLLLIALTAPDLIPFLFGVGWERSVTVLQILCWVSLLQLMLAFHPVILASTGGMRLYFRFTVLSLGVNVIAFLLGLQWGIVGVATAFAVSSTALAILLTYLTARRAGVPVATPLRSLRRLWLPTLALAGVGLAVRRLGHEIDLEPVIRICVVVSVGGVAYLGTLAAFAPDLIAEGKVIVRRVSRLSGGEDTDAAA